MPVVKEALERVETYPGDGEIRVGLFQNNLTPTIDTVFGDLTEADFSGYARQSISNSKGVAPDDMRQAIYETAIFEHDGGATSNQIYGWFVVDNNGGSPILHHTERFGGAPLTMDSSDDDAVVDLTVKYGND